MAKLGDWIKSINNKQSYLIENDVDETEFSRISFLIVRNFSNFPDTVLQANEINEYANSAFPRMIYDHLFYSIRKRNRFAKWNKKSDNSEAMEIVKQYYGYNDVKAADALTLLTGEQIEELKQRMYTGGVSKNERGNR